MIGPIRQELLSGISSHTTYLKLQDNLKAFEDISILTQDYERAAEMFNLCRNGGVQGSQIEFLICAAAEIHHLSIYRLDNDFEQYAKHLSLFFFY